MRKVEFQYWIYPVKKDISQGRSVNTGTGHFSEPQEGLFHGWGYETHEDANSIAMDSIALVEHSGTGQMYKVIPSKLRFVEVHNGFDILKKEVHDILRKVTGKTTKNDDLTIILEAMEKLEGV